MLELRGIEKSYGGRKVISDVCLRIRPGTIHAIVGENGAGKSTLMKIVYGMVAPDAGEIKLHGKKKTWSSSREAIRNGIGMVHQHFMLAGSVPVLDNIILGQEIRRSYTPFIDRKTAFKQVLKLGESLGLTKQILDSDVRECPLGVQQRIEILKLLYGKAQLLILDEPTAVLSPLEVETFLDLLRHLKAEGRSVVFISHKLREVLAVSDSVTVLRAGRVVSDRMTKDATLEEFADLMIGRKSRGQSETSPIEKLDENVLSKKKQDSEPAIVFNHLHLQTQAGPVINDLNFHVRQGEIVGIAGVEGNGQREIFESLIIPESLLKRVVNGSGQVQLLGQTLLDPNLNFGIKYDAREKLGVIPADRHHEGLLLEESLKENFKLGSDFCSKDIDEKLAWVIKEFDLRPPLPSLAVKNFSGGNQQKLIVGRELCKDPRFILAVQPTRGVDIGAIELIHRKLKLARKSGAAILLISSELDEILALSDRILVLFRGGIASSFEVSEFTDQEKLLGSIGIAMGGVFDSC